jgi:hypothetical protein
MEKNKDGKREMKFYLSFTVVFGVLLLLTVAFAVFVPTNRYFEEDCFAVDATVTRIYSNKSASLRMETEESEALYVLPMSYKLTVFMNEANAVTDEGEWDAIIVRIWVSEEDIRSISNVPKTVTARGIEMLATSEVLLSFDEANEVARQKLLGDKIMFVCAAGAAAIVCLYHTVRTAPKKQRQTNETEQADDMI